MEEDLKIDISENRELIRDIFGETKSKRMTDEIITRYYRFMRGEIKNQNITKTEYFECDCCAK
jgi:hypothetical protein